MTLLYKKHYNNNVLIITSIYRSGPTSGNTIYKLKLQNDLNNPDLTKLLLLHTILVSASTNSTCTSKYYSDDKQYYNTRINHT